MWLINKSNLHYEMQLTCVMVFKSTLKFCSIEPVLLQNTTKLHKNNNNNTAKAHHAFYVVFFPQIVLFNKQH